MKRLPKSNDNMDLIILICTKKTTGQTFIEKLSKCKNAVF